MDCAGGTSVNTDGPIHAVVLKGPLSSKCTALFHNSASIPAT
jgi:hypothetical protein